MPTTKDTPATLDQLHAPKPNPVVLDAHKAELACLKAQQDANRPELTKCLNPYYAAAREAEKAVYTWTVRAEWLGQSHESEGLANMQSEQTVVAQSEADAWAAFCDKIGHWPSRRHARPIIKRGKQLAAEAVAALQAAGGGADGELPTVVIPALTKKTKRG
jgi:hypothetical protein